MNHQRINLSGEKTNLRRLHIPWFYLYNILEITKLYKWKTYQWLSEVNNELRRALKTKEDLSKERYNQWNYPSEKAAWNLDVKHERIFLKWKIKGASKTKVPQRLSYPSQILQRLSYTLTQCENLWLMTLTSNKVCESLEKWIESKVCKINNARL